MRKDRNRDVPRALSAACFLSNFDRFAVTPMLVVIAASLHERLGAVVLAATGYFLAYGCAQPLWGVLSDRHGRVRVMRCALAGTAVLGCASALAPSLPALVALRVATGALLGAVVPTSLSYVGDTVPVRTRQQALADLQLALALGTAGATVIAGTIAQVVSWRVMFALPALIAAALVIALGQLPAAPISEQRGGRPVRSVLASRWAWLLMALGLLEGAVLLGCFTFLAAALQHRGLTAAGAGMITALYGFGTLVFSRPLKRVALRPAWSLICAGGAMITGGYLLAALSPTIVGIGVTASLLGGGWAFMHSSLQTWATTLVPKARGTATALFASALFVGSAAGSALGAPLAGRAAFGQLFALAALAALILTVMAGALRRRYQPVG